MILRLTGDEKLDDRFNGFGTVRDTVTDETAIESQYSVAQQ